MAPVGSATYWIIKKRFASQKGLLVQEIKGLNEAMDAQRLRIESLEGELAGHEALIRELRTKDPEWLAERSRSEDRIEDCFTYMKVFSPSLSKVAEKASLFILDWIEKDPKQLSKAEILAKAAYLLDVGNAEALGLSREIGALVRDRKAGGSEENEVLEEINLIQYSKIHPEQALELIASLLDRAIESMNRHRAKIADHILSRCEQVIMGSEVHLPLMLRLRYLKTRGYCQIAQSDFKGSIDSYSDFLIYYSDAMQSGGMTAEETNEALFVNWQRGAAHFLAGDYQAAYEDYFVEVQKLPSYRIDNLFATILIREYCYMLHVTGQTKKALGRLRSVDGLVQEQFGPISVEAEYNRVAIARFLADSGEFARCWTYLEPMLERREGYLEGGHLLGGYIDAVLSILYSHEGPWAMHKVADLAPSESIMVPFWYLEKDLQGIFDREPSDNSLRVDPSESTLNGI